MQMVLFVASLGLLFHKQTNRTYSILIPNQTLLLKKTLLVFIVPPQKNLKIHQKKTIKKKKTITLRIFLLSLSPSPSHFARYHHHFIIIFLTIYPQNYISWHL
jgi:hypothetical protein